ncbi:MAG: molybdopterin-guanine dinucleotide biosynthesis protein B [Chloroflexi bacterium]|nr:molybdopterin-guanine dinucleotide biosynthesis protein B [Chloroflexota bacterium]
MPPTISIVGKSKSGKTTLIEGLVSALKSRGYRVATVKHATHRDLADKPGKDSWRHIQAGSEATATGSSDGIVLVKPTTHDPPLEEVTRLFNEEYDIVIAEGFKQGNAPKIEVHRKQIGTPLRGLKNLAAIATDEPLQSSVRQFPINDIESLADFIENNFMKLRGKRISIYVNNASRKLSATNQEMIINTLIAMTSNANYTQAIESIDISYKKGRS